MGSLYRIASACSGPRVVQQFMSSNNSQHAFSFSPHIPHRFSSFLWPAHRGPYEHWSLGGKSSMRRARTRSSPWGRVAAWGRRGAGTHRGIDNGQNALPQRANVMTGTVTQLSLACLLACTTSVTTVSVKRHRGEPGHTRDTLDTRTHGSHRRTPQAFPTACSLHGCPLATLTHP